MIGDGWIFAKHCFLLSVVGHFSLFPLLFQPTESPIKLELLLLQTIISYVLFRETYSRKGKLLHLWETIYLLGLIFVQLFYSLVHPLLFQVATGDFNNNNDTPHQVRYPFLPLLLTSVYCSIGIVYIYVSLYMHFFTLQQRDQSKK
jgi:alpha-1,3-glucosyltransferase